MTAESRIQDRAHIRARRRRAEARPAHTSSMNLKSGYPVSASKSSSFEMIPSTSELRPEVDHDSQRRGVTLSDLIQLEPSVPVFIRGMISWELMNLPNASSRDIPPSSMPG